MREILFRGKRVDNGEWVEGCFFMRFVRPDVPPLFYNPNTHTVGVVDAIQVCDREDPASLEYHNVIPETVGQYTGLKDKNGKKIFEDDIVKSNIALWGKDKYIVSFEETRGGWYPFACGDGCGCCEEETIRTEHVTVIGNIHDNLELAEGAYE